jgi:hypothetical protein
MRKARQAGKQNTTPAARVSRVDASVPQKSIEGSRTNRTGRACALCAFAPSILLSLDRSMWLLLHAPAGRPGELPRITHHEITNRFRGMSRGMERCGRRRQFCGRFAPAYWQATDWMRGVGFGPTTHNDPETHTRPACPCGPCRRPNLSERVCSPPTGWAPPVPRRESRRSSVCAVLQRFAARHNLMVGMLR